MANKQDRPKDTHERVMGRTDMDQEEKNRRSHIGGAGGGGKKQK